MSVKELMSYIKNDDRDGLVNFLNKNDLQNTGYNDFCHDYEDYYILQDLLKKGNKSMALTCIEAGFRVFVPNTHRRIETLMHLAVMLEYSEIIQSLLNRHADTVFEFFINQLK